MARFDGWALYRAPLELFRGERPVKLQEQPLQILEAVVRKPGELVTRDELTARLWPDTVVDFDASLNTAVRKLRAALTDDPEAPRYVETVPRQGYRFVGVVDRPAVAPSIEASPPAPTPDPLSQPAPGAGVQVTGPRRAWWRVGLPILGLAATAALAVFLTRPTGGATGPDAGSRPAVYRLAVLPFENLSPDPANAFFADGMHEEVLSALGSRARQLEVISRTTMMTYRGKPADVRALARDLGATHVLESSVRREASTVRVTLQLVDAVADRQIWSRSYQATLVDAMTLQAQLAREVAEQLAIQLPTARTGQLPPPRSPEAYDHWLKGTLAWQDVGGGGATVSQIARVEAMFTRAIELDDTYGAAYADRARVRVARFASHADGSETNLAGARADIALAQKYAGGTPHVLMRAAGMAFLVDRDLPRALGLIEAAEQVGPLDSGLLLTKGNFLAFDGRLEESLAVQAQAARIDPGNAGIYRYWVQNLAAAHRPREMLRVLTDFDSRFPGRLYRGDYLFAFTGSTTHWWDDVARLRAGGEPNRTLSAECDVLRYEGRLDVLRTRLATAAPVDVVQHSPIGSLVGASSKPVAELRGWERRLAGDAAGAAREGAMLAAFIERLPKAAWNEWWRRLLSAESALLVGDHARAIEHARAALRLVGKTPTFPESVHVRLMAARVFAWGGEQDEAMALLETLSRGYPGVGPATIVRDPLFSTPLGANPRWQALAQTLNAEIAANQALLR
ncbi:MAG: winged helix-turn-helix domain-containing protein [Vicinamibacteraceae bacterium]